MSEKKDDGGPAFPALQTLIDPETGHAQPPITVGGMSLRDYYAGKALAGMHARDAYDMGQSRPEQRAHLAYADADAMLAERSK